MKHAPPASPAAAAVSLTRHHLRRLRQYYRSAGWPCQDNIELDLLDRGYVRREIVAGAGLERIVVTDTGVGLLVQQLECNRQAHAEHDALVDRVACWLRGDKRLVFRNVALRARVEDRWSLSKPDVFSVRNVTASRRLHPAVHEIKARRADLLGDLKNPAKRLGYQSYSQSFYYVIAAGIADPSEVPGDCGLIVATDTSLHVLRHPQQRPVLLTTAQWIALARAGAEYGPDDDSQLAF